MQRKKLEELNLMDDFLFHSMMAYPEIGEAFPKRVRFYHAIIDSRSLKSGEDFGKLKNVYVIFICNYDPFGYDRIKYTIKNMCVEDLLMPYEDGARTIVLYTKGTKGEVSEELRQFLNYMEHTTGENAVNDNLKHIQKMVDTVKQDGEVSLEYMKGFERDMLMYEEGREEERKNTERERQRAENEKKTAERERLKAENEKKNVEKERLRANAAEKEVKRLKEELEKMIRLQGKS